MRRSLVIFAALAAPAAAFMPVSSASPLTTAQRGSVRSSPNVLHMAAEPSSRREFVGAAAGLAAGFVLPLRGGGSASAADAPAGPFKLPPLPYDYKALEPAIDEATMKFHHDKHFNAYMTNLNKALEGKGSADLVELQKGAIKAGPAIRNNGGGFYNHGLFFESMTSPSKSGAPSPALAKAIDDNFGSMEKMKEKFSDVAAKRFGSGWAWLGVTADGKLAISSTPNQDNPLMEGAEGEKMIPFLGLDIWEHAYYLKYQNLRPSYIKEWWTVVNWAKVSEYYEKYAAVGKPVVWG